MPEAQSAGVNTHNHYLNIHIAMLMPHLEQGVCGRGGGVGGKLFCVESTGFVRI